LASLSPSSKDAGAADAARGSNRRATFRDVTLVLYLIFPLVLLLYGLIFVLTQIKHSRPQAYYLKKKRGATIANESRPYEPWQ
jgi:hypothetical protein